MPWQQLLFIRQAAFVYLCFSAFVKLLICEFVYFCAFVSHQAFLVRCPRWQVAAGFVADSVTTKQLI